MLTNPQFENFLTCCLGNWVTERTYHYLTNQMIERSRTEFQIKPLTIEAKMKVLTDNKYVFSDTINEVPGFNLGFYTVSETGEEVTQNLNLLFILKEEEDSILTGDYLRDRAYEEAKPIISEFRFEQKTKELLMRTNYSRVVSVDSITLINPNLRIRKIINYQRPELEHPLDKVLLVGFGVEEKVN